MVANFRKKRKGEFQARKILFPIAGILFFLLMVVLVFVDMHIYKQKKELVSKINFYQNQIQSIESDNQQLRDEMANTENIDYLEKIAYEQLGEQKPGEQAVIFVAPDQKPAQVSEQQNIWTGWFSGIWNWIKSKL